MAMAMAIAMAIAMAMAMGKHRVTCFQPVYMSRDLIRIQVTVGVKEEEE